MTPGCVLSGLSAGRRRRRRKGGEIITGGRCCVLRRPELAVHTARTFSDKIAVWIWDSRGARN